MVDRKDNCPDEKGTPENQGCAAKQLVVMTDKQLEILDQVFFPTGKSVIRERSFPLLNNLVAVLKSHPEITEVEVAGHTDDKGEAADNLALSQERAEAVVQYLVDLGVSADRLRAKGYGEDKPSVEGTDRNARQANRRVEFNVIR